MCRNTPIKPLRVFLAEHFTATVLPTMSIPSTDYLVHRLLLVDRVSEHPYTESKTIEPIKLESCMVLTPGERNLNTRPTLPSLFLPPSRAK
jgi:hypothetical protein